MHLSITASMMNLATMTLMESPDMHRSLSFSTISCWVYGWWERIPDWPNPARVCLFWTLWSVASNHCYLPWSIHQDTVPLLSCERSCGWSLLSALTILWGNQLWILAAQSMWIQRSGWYQLVCLWCSCLVPPHLLLPSSFQLRWSKHRIATTSIILESSGMSFNTYKHTYLNSFLFISEKPLILSIDQLGQYWSLSATSACWSWHQFFCLLAASSHLWVLCWASYFSSSHLIAWLVSLSNNLLICKAFSSSVSSCFHLKSWKVSCHWGMELFSPFKAGCTTSVPDSESKTMSDHGSIWDGKCDSLLEVCAHLPGLPSSPVFSTETLHLWHTMFNQVGTFISLPSNDILR